MTELNGKKSPGFDFSRSFPLRAGILLIAETAIVSFVSAVCLLCITVSRGIKLQRRSKQFGGDDPPMQPVSILFLFAIFMDSIQALGSILNVRWAFEGQVTDGTYCNAQAALKQLGNDGTAWFTIAIALMTFIQVVFPNLLSPAKARLVTFASIVFIFVFIFLIVAIPSITIPHYYGNTGMWCWIKGVNTMSMRLRIGSEYAYFWLAALVSIVCYGWIVIRWLQQAGEQGDKLLVRDALAMSWYPAAYLLEIFPISLVRFLTFNTTHKIGHGWTILASVCFASSGMINMLLWLLTGRQFGFTLPPAEDEDEEEGNTGSDEPARRRSGDIESGDSSPADNANATRMRRRTAGGGSSDSGAGDLSADGDIVGGALKSPSLTATTFPVRRRSTHSVGVYGTEHGSLPVSATPIGMAAGVTSSDEDNDDILGPPPPPVTWGQSPHARYPHLKAHHARSLSRSSEGDGSSSSPGRSLGGGRSSRSGYVPDTISMTSVTTGTGVDDATFARSLQYPPDNNIMGLGVSAGPPPVAVVGGRSRNTSPVTTLSSSGAGRSSLGPPSPYAPTHDSRPVTTKTTLDEVQPSPS